MRWIASIALLVILGLLIAWLWGVFNSDVVVEPAQPLETAPAQATE